jgi:hypothetical protein
MSNQVRADKQLIIAAMGTGSAALTGGILGLIEAWTGFALYSLMVWFIIPVEVFLAGFAAAGGYYSSYHKYEEQPDVH